MNSKQRCILIVEDSFSSFLLYKSVLEEEGYAQIESATSIKEAILAYAKFKPDVILLDIMLSNGEDGLKLVEYITAREQHREKKTPIIIISSKESETFQEIISKNGSVNFIPKPVDFKLLVTKIYSILNPSYE